MLGGVVPVRLGEMMLGRPGATGRIGPIGERETFVGEEETPVDALPDG